MMSKSYSNANSKFEKSPSRKPSLVQATKMLETEDIIDSPETNSECSFLFEPGLDYSLNGNGSVTCKICKETVPSRTHWYRHKYKVNVYTLIILRIHFFKYYTSHRSIFTNKPLFLNKLGP